MVRFKKTCRELSSVRRTVIVIVTLVVALHISGAMQWLGARQSNEARRKSTLEQPKRPYNIQQHEQQFQPSRPQSIQQHHQQVPSTSDTGRLPPSSPDRKSRAAIPSRSSETNQDPSAPPPEITIKVENSASSHHIFSHYTGTTPPCRPYLESKRSYCARHGYTFRYYHDYNYVNNRKTSFQEPLSLRLHLARTYLYNGNVRQLTYFDMDTIIIEPEWRLDDIFAAEQAKHPDIPCTVFVQADPYLINTGFFSLKNTHWVREQFLPTWDRLQIMSWKMGYYMNQPAFNAAILHIALLAHNASDLTEPCWPNNRELLNEIVTWANTTRSGYPGPEYHQGHKLLDYFETLVGKRRAAGKSRTKLTYYCASYVYDKVLKLPMTARSFKVSETDGVCFMGFEGPQINRHHMLPGRALDKLRKILSPAPGAPEAPPPSTETETAASNGITRHTARPFGTAYSRDLFLLHSHFEELIPGFCDMGADVTFSKRNDAPDHHRPHTYF